MMKAKTLKKGLLPVLALTITLVASNAVVGCTMKVYATSEKKDVRKAFEQNSMLAANKNITSAISEEKADMDPVPGDSPKQQPPENPEPIITLAETPKETPKETPEETPEETPAPVPESTPEPTRPVMPESTPVIVQEITPEPTKEPVEDENPGNSSPPPDSPEDSGQVNAAVQLYEGGYIDNIAYGEEEIEKYYEVGVTNITATSFDFTIYEVETISGTSEIVFLTSTAFFTGDGTTAVCEDENYTLLFSFPDNHASYPVATDMVISGFPPLEGKIFVNSGMPVS